MAKAPFETKTIRLPSGEIAGCENSSRPRSSPIVRMAGRATIGGARHSFQ